MSYKLTSTLTLVILAAAVIVAAGRYVNHSWKIAAKNVVYRFINSALFVKLV